ncbi:MAG: thioredoxin family protein [Candidatus Eisenbacteria bacterium]
MKSSKRFPILRALALGTLLLVASVAAAAGQGVVWRAMTIDQAVAEASSSGKMVLVDVFSDHCGQCGVMDQEFWNTPAGADYADGMIPLKIDSATPDGYQFQIRYGVTGLPTTILIRPDGQELDRVVGYDGVQEFLTEAGPMKDGVDSLPVLEEQMAKSPQSADAILAVMERYLFRKRLADAQSLSEKVLALDPDNKGKKAEKALMWLAKYMEFVDANPAASYEYWKTMLDKYPTATAAGSAVDHTCKQSATLGRRAEWIEWIAGILEKQPQNGRLQYAAAISADRAGIRDIRFAKAARTARSLGVGSALMDSLAVRMEKGAAGK